MPLGNRSRPTSPVGEEPQGPSSMDNNLELDADFPLNMVTIMQESAAKKTHKMVIGQTIRKRLMMKVLNDCLKLHLPTFFVLTTLLTCGFFEALFSNEEGAKAIWKITLVEWSDMNFFFSRYISNFDSNVQGVEAMFMHEVKVQFPNLHEQFKNDKALTIMASKIGEVMEIELVELYMKRHAGLMITVEIQDISRLVGHICIPSMVKSATLKDTNLQKNMYLRLPNQCKKCCQFSHFAHACIVSKALIWDGSTPLSKFPTWSESVAKGSNPMLFNKTIFAIKNARRNHEIENKNHKKITDTNTFAAQVGVGHVLRPLSENPTTKNVKKNPTSE